jgi:hypothetical protein
MLLRTRSRLSPQRQIEYICRRTRNGDWFLLYQLGKNIDPLIFREFIEALYKKLEAKERGEEEEFLT